MLKRLPPIVLALLLGSRLYGATYTVAPGATTSTIQSTINTAAAASGSNIVQFGIGTYNITGVLTVPCPVGAITLNGATMVSSGSHQTKVLPGTGNVYPGPQGSWTTDPYTTKLLGAVTGASMFYITSGCTGAINIYNIESNGGQPSAGGGGSLNFGNTGGSNVTVQNNWFYGSWGNASTTGHTYDAQIYMGGNSTNGGQVWTGVTINWNNFGSSTDCNAIINLDTYQGGNYDSHGGYCNGISIQTSATNLNIANNAFYHEEQCTKGFLGGNAPPNVFNQINGHYDYNDCSFGHRNPWEFQLAPQSQTYSFNSAHDMILPGYTGFVLSAPQGPTYNVENNVFVNNTSTYAPGNSVSQPNTANSPAICECWGNGTFKNNLSQGITGTVVTYGYAGPITIANNISQMPANVFLNPDASPAPSPVPTQSNNTQTTTISPLTSAAPTISPAAGSVTFPATITLTDAGLTNGVGPQGNTGVWYTTDGSNPVPGSGTATRVDSGSTITINGASTVCAVGMWGAANQPATYPTGYGFVPSAKVCNTYTGGGTQFTVNPGASTSTIQSAINSAAASTAGGVVFFNPGTYSGLGVLNIPCSVNTSIGTTLTGPATAYPVNWSARPTALLVSAASGGSPLLQVANCTRPLKIQYLDINGNRPSSGGGSLYLSDGGVSNVTVQYNYLHGNQEVVPFASYYGCTVNGKTGECGAWNYDDGDANLIRVDGYQNGATDANLLFQYNIFGNPSPGDCSNPIAFTYQSFPTSPYVTLNGAAGYDATGGSCNGIGIYGNLNGFVVKNNVFQQLEQGMKYYEGGGAAPNLYYQTNVNVSNNDFSNIHRIAIENQGSPANAETYDSNDFHDWIYPAFGSWILSFANQGAPNNVTNTVFAGNTYSTTNNAGPGPAEWWGYTPQYFTNNLDQGYWNCGVQWGYVQAPTYIQNNTFQLIQGTSHAVCNEENLGSGSTPIQSGNVNTSTTPASITSVAPTFSPASGALIAAGSSVTITDAGYTTGAIPQGNTSIWYTTDGSTPAPRSGTSVHCLSPCTVGPVVAATTVKALGMWGSLTQPVSYPANYGFTPSAVVSAAYTISGGSTPVLTGASLNCNSQNTINVGASLQCNTTCNYTLGVSDDCTNTDVYGNDAAFASSNTSVFTTNTTGAVSGVGVGTANLTSTVGGFNTNPYTITVQNPAPTLQSVTLSSSSNSVAVGGNLQITATANYSGNVQTNVTGPGKDLYGNVVTGYSVSNANASITSSGLLTGVATGPTTVNATFPGQTIAPLTINITTPTPPTGTLTGVTVSGTNSVIISQTSQLSAKCAYSTSSGTVVTDCTHADQYGTTAFNWSSDTTSVAVVNSSGLLTGVTAGTANITVQAGSFTANPVFPVSVTAVPATTVCGNNQVTTTIANSNYNGYNNAVYCVTGSNSGGYGAAQGAFYLSPGSIPSGTNVDLLVTAASTSTTQAAAPVCKATYTTTGTTSPAAWVTVNLFLVSAPATPCTLPANTAYWIGLTTNASGALPEGFWNCNNGTTGCNGGVPTLGNGTYPYFYIPQVYGTYSGNGTAMHTTGTGPALQPSSYVTLTTPAPTLVAGHQGTSFPVAGTNVVGIGSTIQFVAYCDYSDGNSYQCFPNPDQYGNTVTACTSSNPTIMTMGAIGSVHPCLATGVSGGAANSQMVLTGSVGVSPWTVNVVQPVTAGSTPSGANIFKR